MTLSLFLSSSFPSYCTPFSDYPTTSILRSGVQTYYGGMGGMGGMGYPGMMGMGGMGMGGMGMGGMGGMGMGGMGLGGMYPGMMGMGGMGGYGMGGYPGMMGMGGGYGVRPSAVCGPDGACWLARGRRMLTTGDVDATIRSRVCRMMTFSISRIAYG